MSALPRTARWCAGRAPRAGAPHARPLATEAGQQRASPLLPESADTVVVGGGSLGASVLYHLQQRGLNAVLLEKDQLTAGTTWHSAGMLWRLRPSDTASVHCLSS